MGGRIYTLNVSDYIGKKTDNIYIKEGKYLTPYCMSKKQWPFLYSNLLHKMGHYFLEDGTIIQYMTYTGKQNLQNSTA